MKYKEIITKEFLEDLYIKKELSINEISKITPYSRPTLVKYMRYYNMEIDNAGKKGRIKSIKSNDLNINYFDNIDEDAKAYILGFLLGDGYIIRERINITVALEDEDIIKQISEKLSAEEYISYSKYKSKNRNEQDKCTLRFRRTEMSEKIHNIGIPYSPKSGKETFINFNNDLTWSFIRGVFDADGCVRVYERDNFRKYKLSFSIGELFCNGLRKFLENQNIILPPKCIRKIPGTFVFEVASKNLLELFKLKMYENSTIHLKRKKIVFDKM